MSETKVRLSSRHQAALSVLAAAGRGVSLGCPELASGMTAAGCEISGPAAKAAADALFRRDLVHRGCDWTGEPVYRITTAGRDWLERSGLAPGADEGN